jgi:two-component system OmpR family sensor kinase
MTHGYKIKEMAIFDKYEYPIKLVLKQSKYGFDEKFYNKFLEMNYELILDKNKVNAITYNPQTKVVVEKKHHKKNDLLRVLKLGDNTYIYIKSQRRAWTYLIKDNNPKSDSIENINIYIMLVFSIIFITIILVYLITLRKLMPLKILKDKVKTLGDENFDFECCNSNGKDEVSQLGMEFKKSALKLKNLKEARNVFIRNIMHELKTPITKGKFLAELEKSPENDLKLKEVFNRLESLINEFASIEELISSNKNIEKKPYFLNDIMDNVKDILMIEDEEIISSYDNKKFEVNFKLFSIAVKNLIDNALKYSDDNKVEVKTEENDILFINSGKELEYELEQYYEPFFANEEKRKNSFGLGLYIIHNILKANGYTLFYEYKDGKNIFTCKKDDELSTI